MLSVPLSNMEMELPARLSSLARGGAEFWSTDMIFRESPPASSAKTPGRSSFPVR